MATVILNIKNENDQPCPDVIGMSEVENGEVLQLLNRKYLKDCGYNKIVADPKDPDPRGIRVATLTRLPLKSRPQSHSPYSGGRFIQEVTLQVDETPITFFVNHWKSRRQSKPGASAESEEGEDKRKASAKVIRDRMKKILEEAPDADIFAMGDFNDEPENNSLKSTLASTMNIEKFFEDDRFLFWNPSAEIARHPAFADADFSEIETIENYRKLRGTYYFWGGKKYLQLDNFHISRGLLDDAGFQYVPNSYQVVRNKKFTDSELRPVGFHPVSKWKGVSDHFPILMRLRKLDH